VLLVQVKGQSQAFVNLALRLISLPIRLKVHLALLHVPTDLTVTPTSVYALVARPPVLLVQVKGQSQAFVNLALRLISLPIRLKVHLALLHVPLDFTVTPTSVYALVARPPALLVQVQGQMCVNLAMRIFSLPVRLALKAVPLTRSNPQTETGCVLNVTVTKL